MGLFSSPPPDDATDNHTRTTTADEAGTIQGVALGAALLVTVVLPGSAVLIAAGIVAHELRRVRARWYLLWAAATFAIALCAATSLTVWVGWLAAHPAHFLPLPTDSTNPTMTTMASFTTRSEADALVCSTVAGAPLAFLSVAAFVRWRAFSRAVRGLIEGPSYSNQRPVGILDRARIRRERRRVAAGHYLPSYPSDTETAPPPPHSTPDDEPVDTPAVYPAMTAHRPR